MTTAECIRQRVSCRRFQETPIPREDIRRVVDLARFSPSWKNTQPVRYIVIDDPALKERMARECIPGQGFNTKTINRAAALAVIAYVPGLSGQGDAPLTESQAAGWEMFVWRPGTWASAPASWAYLTPAPPGVCWSWRACAPPASSPWAIPSSGKTVPAARRRRSCCPSDKTIIR